MKKIRFLFIIVFSLVVLASSNIAQEKKIADVKEEVASTIYSDVRIKNIPVAMQCWTFRSLTFYETLNKVEKLGVKYLEAFPGQKIDKNSDRKMGPELNESDINEIKEQLNKHGITLRAFGVTNFENNEEAARETFEFVKKMDIKVLVVEPKYDDYSIIDKMVKEYDIPVGIHNHPKDSKYWNPETVMKNIENLDERIGFCGDTGHWLRSGINPVEALRYAKGRIYNIHLKDLDQAGIIEAQDVPFGSGKANIHDVMAELTLQNYRGSISIEHERNDEQPDPSASIAKGLEYLNSITYYKGYEELIGWDGRGFSKHGWNHYGPGYFSLDEKSGVIYSSGGMGLFWYSAKKFSNFTIDLEYKCETPSTNSGIFVRVPNFVISDDYIHHSFEIQIDNKADSLHRTGAIYDANPAIKSVTKQVGEWNHYVISFIDDNIKVKLNGELVNDWKARPAGKIKDFAKEGYIGLQNHDSNSKVYFRNIFVKEIK